MLKVRGRLVFVAVLAVMAVVAAGCAASEEPSGPNTDGVPSVAGICPEENPDCGHTPIGGDLPPDIADGDGETQGPAGLIVDGGLDIEKAIAYEGTEVVAVQGFFVAQGQTARLCEALAESFPPQCGGADVVITNPEAMSEAVLLEEGDTQWTEGYVTVLGHIVDGELTIASYVSG